MKNSNLETGIESGNGIVTERTSRPVEEVVRHFEELLAQKGIKLFAIVDHSGEAAKVGLEMHPTKLLIFGSSKMGTPVMLASPSSAIDLPLKVLVAESANGEVQVSYNSASFLQRRHGIPDDLVRPLASVADLVKAVLSR
ncbi:MAG: DUF302 domain-containing protein [Acidobacteriaceae bacterium]|nr:DUF302 domain-containing protein [Acidobacteriaceae bacterium]